VFRRENPKYATIAFTGDDTHNEDDMGGTRGSHTHAPLCDIATNTAKYDGHVKIRDEQKAW
jgi:hypothetical protein